MPTKYDFFIKRRLGDFERKCSLCGNIFYSKFSNKKKFCSRKCSEIALRKAERPSLETLKNDINSMSFVKIGEKYGVSNNAIKKWAKQYSLI